MRTKIIAGFPGVGKTEAVKVLGDRAADSDSSGFSWTMDSHGKKRNPDFPKNYIDHIKSLIGKKEYIFVSTHKEVRDALRDNCIFFYLVYPPLNAKDVYLERYKGRGSSEAFVQLLSGNWEAWLDELRLVGPGCYKVEMSNLYLIDELEKVFGGVRGATGTRYVRHPFIELRDCPRPDCGGQQALYWMTDCLGKEAGTRWVGHALSGCRHEEDVRV